MIVLQNVCKTLSGREVLKDISFHIAENENVGIIGLNGAGKTTLLNTIAGMIKPDSGFIRSGGKESLIEEKQALRKLAYVSGTRSQLWETLKVKDSFDNCISMYRLNRKDAGERLILLADIFEIRAFMDRTPEGLSLGERMRCEMVYALLAQPKILMLDEVMNGLDLSIKYKIMGYFEKYKNERRVTMIYTSNQLAEVEQLCDRVLLIDQGRLIFDGSMERIMKQFSPYYRIEIKISEGFPDFEDLPLEKYSMDNDGLTIVYDKQKIGTAQILKQVMEKCKIKDVKLFEPNLEDTIKKIYRG
ncbi:ATP-binding cassette domain-containing protein [Lachnospiraceae bacterium 64-25]|nr:ABC transporter ATP-binding protein NatA [Lachnospiraceae bacterium]